MGGGFYSSTYNSVTNKVDYDSGLRSKRLASTGIDFTTMSRDEVFSKRSIDNLMNPRDIEVRESRDSDEHPESMSIILGLDVTGSMRDIPHYLVKEGLPMIMGKLIQNGLQHPQVLFLGIGDHECDKAPLQVGQFESSDELLDKWLTDVYLEGGGGGNYGESYLLAWYFAAFHTSIDCFEKRKQKGFLFTIGDEPCLKDLPDSALKKIMGPGQYKKYTHTELLEKAQEKYEVYHIHVVHSGARDDDDIADWKQLMKDRLIVVYNKDAVASTISDTIMKEIESRPRQTSVVTSAADVVNIGPIEHIDTGKVEDRPSIKPAPSML
jgi:hypothetical protein